MTFRELARQIDDALYWPCWIIGMAGMFAALGGYLFAGML